MKSPTLLAYPFRVFFLLTGVYGTVLALLWIGMLFWGWPAPEAVGALRWHAHEMLFGLVPAAIAGFLLTAICNWTGCPPLRNGWLLALAVLWLAGRLAPWWPGTTALTWMVIDLLFLLAMTGYVARVILTTHNHRNLVMVAVLALLLIANLMTHLANLGTLPGGAALGETTAIHVMLLLMVVIGGRITPLFTANWLERHGCDRSLVQTRPRLDTAAIVATALLIPSGWLGDPVFAAGIALAAGLLNILRLSGWGTRYCLREPLLWILHLGYAWIAVALLLRGLTPWMAGLTTSLWVHAAGVGAMGTLIIGVMSRVALGHTGRPLILPRGTVVSFALITLAAIARLLTASGRVPYLEGMVFSAIAFSAAFLIFTVLYWPVLCRPRVDGKPG